MLTILRRSHHRSRHGDAPSPPMLIILIFVLPQPEPGEPPPPHDSAKVVAS
ncbi:hypothetical protein [uncultured Prevotella sp.]|uniref:hypothetical protein n=1 Tax=uncultured Prevotella sp. TaxID=159272 RepID=UPI0026082751|nr:hypothetical protein [uncultured Prevotella sp.]